MKIIKRFIFLLGIVLIFSACSNSKSISFYILVDCNDSLTSYNITYDSEIHNLKTSSPIFYSGSATNIFPISQISVYQSAYGSQIAEFIPITIYRVSGMTPCNMYVIPKSEEVDKLLNDKPVINDRLQLDDETIRWLITSSIGHITLPSKASEAFFKLRIK